MIKSEEMKKLWGNFSLRCKIIGIEDGVVKTRDLAIEGKEIQCPHCHKTFIYDP